MKICLISKYPPIEGGESTKAYWLAKALGERGHEIHVVTNAWEVENDYREQIESCDLDCNYQPKGVHLHNTNPFIDPAYIPYSRPYTEKIASLAIDTIKEYDLQLIDSWYILPYGISGFLAKTETNKPQILRHAGSDMDRLFNSPYLRTLFASLFKKVNKIVTYQDMRKIFLGLGISESKLFYNSKVSVDTHSFNPEVAPIDLSDYIDKDIADLPIITYIGKIGITKGIYELIEAASKIKGEFFLLFVSKGKGLARFKEFVKKMGLEDKTIFIGFLPPWKIPAVIKRSRSIVIPERDFPVEQHTPILPREVLAVGKCLILSEEICNKGPYRTMNNESDGCIVVVNPKDIQQFKEKLEKIIRDPSYSEEIGYNGHKFSEKIEKFDEYVEDTISLYKQVLMSS